MKSFINRINRIRIFIILGALIGLSSWQSKSQVSILNQSDVGLKFGAGFDQGNGYARWDTTVGGYGNYLPV